MPSVFLTADPHFGHENINKFTYTDQFTGEENKRVRPFANAAEMNDRMISGWNATVKPTDKVYVLGDVAMNKNALREAMPHLNGDKVLIKGNHDILDKKFYDEYFRDIRAYHVMNGCILSHIPIHKASLARFGCNIHGHTHQNRVLKARGVNAVTGEILYGKEVDPDYICVSVEHTNWVPILFEEVLDRIVKQGGQIGFRNTKERVM